MRRQLSGVDLTDPGSDFCCIPPSRLTDVAPQNQVQTGYEKVKNRRGVPCLMAAAGGVFYGGKGKLGLKKGGGLFSLRENCSSCRPLAKSNGIMKWCLSPYGADTRNRLGAR